MTGTIALDRMEAAADAATLRDLQDIALAATREYIDACIAYGENPNAATKAAADEARERAEEAGRRMAAARSEEIPFN